jgi:hypothetical protein
MGETINAYKVLVGNLKEIDHKKDLGVDGNKMFKWTINRGGMWIGFIWLRTKTCHDVLWTQ